LPDIKNTFIDFTTESLISNGANVLSFLPETQNPDLLKRIGGINFQGNFSGFISDFVAQGNLQTDLGNLSSDVNLKTTDGNLSYSGSISSDRFNIGKLTNRTVQLGELTFSAEVNGQGRLNKNPKVTIKGLIEDLDANQYHYRNVNLNGVLTKNEFSGAVVSSDLNADQLHGYAGCDRSLHRCHQNHHRLILFVPE
jgi:hypothetical protein